ncbi:hypothetical protein T4D_13787 [Trichinella pseudospiralis]|uniref:Uncharacterized protein n=1 Tax=Trichinella pseudospiralis TaxID=6337 RepID=A0A0V1FP48_TRIPS|nr:hypothetical protein T4D_13787 [Trichinella pseudospiralis]
MNYKRLRTFYNATTCHVCQANKCPIADKKAPLWRFHLFSNVCFIKLIAFHAKRITCSACLKQAITRINLRYRKESGRPEHSYGSDFPMYRLADVESFRIWEVAVNRRYQRCFKVTNYCLWIELRLTLRTAALFIKA